MAKSQAPILNRGPMFGNNNRPILNKLGSLFGKKEQVESAQEIYPVYHQRMPNSTTSAEPPILDQEVKPAAAQPAIKPITHKETTSVAAKPSPILPQFANRIGHEEDYSWVTGQLEIEDGVPVIHYATPDTMDRFNGRLVLQVQGGLKGVQPGDLISVRGSLMNQAGRMSYRAVRVDVIESGR